MVDITDTTDSSDATGDTGALRTEGGASIAKKLFVGTDLDVDGTTNLDNTDIDGTLVVDGSNISLDSTTTLNIDNSDTSNGITIGTATSGVPISIGHGTSETTVNDNLTVTGNLTINGTTTTVATTNTTVADHLIKLGQGYTGSANDQGFIVTRGDGSSSNTANRGFIWDESADEFATIAANTEAGTTTGNVTINDYANIRVGALTADDASLFSGGIKVANDGNIGSAGDTDAIAISSSGVVTFSQAPVFPDGSINIADLDIDGATDINAAIVDADLFIVDDGAGGTNRKTTASRMKTYFQSNVTASEVAADDIVVGDAAVTIGNGSTSADITIDSGDDIVLDAAGGNIEFKDGGTLKLTLDMDGTAGAQVIQLGVDSDDLIFKQYDGTTVLTLDDDTTVKVATDLTVGDDLSLISDSSVLSFGANSEITVTHVHDVGLNIKNTNTGDDKPIILTLQTGETDLAADEVIGAIRWQAPDEAQGTDAILVSAAVQAVAEGNHSSSSNATRLEFHTGASEAAAVKMMISSAGNVGIGNTDPEAFGSLIDNLVVGTTSGNNGMTIVSGTDSGGRLCFADNTSSPQRGMVEYSHDSDSMKLNTNGATRTTIDSSGNLTQTANITAFSDRRLKSDIQTVENALDKVEQLRGVTYTRNDIKENGQQLGVIAQEVEEVFPQVVLTADDERGTKSVDYGRISR